MAQLTVSVPRAVVDALRRALLVAHADRVAALRRAVETYERSHEGLDDVQGAVVEIADLHDTLAQIGWVAASTPRPVEVTAHPEVLVDAAEALLARHGPTPAVLELVHRVEHGGGR